MLETTAGSQSNGLDTLNVTDLDALDGLETTLETAARISTRWETRI